MKVKDIPKCAMFAALSAILSQIFIPIGTLPINLTFISIFLAGGILGPALGFLSQLVYVLIGAAGVPVFSGFTGGLGIIAGPTGGFIIGYMLGAATVGFVIKKLGRSYKGIGIALVCGWFVAYTPGVIRFMQVLEVGFIEALPMCLLPYLPGDIAKIFLSGFLIKKLHPIINVSNK
jgi:biotin transport system substrate-specific component